MNYESSVHLTKGHHSSFIGDDFLLQSEPAKLLYHDYAKNLPIIDYHNHLSASAIAGNKKFSTITEIWLKDDHYKWRAMRALGIDEHCITGTAGDEEKFNCWAAALPQLIRNPLFHWSQMELHDPFGIDEYLTAATAGKIYKACNELLQQDGFSTQGLLRHFKVEVVGTTDDPCDDLQAHQHLAVQSLPFKMVPSFRPDKVFQVHSPEQHHPYIERLTFVSNTEIKDIESLLEALQKRVDYFHQHGCRVADHGLLQMPLPARRSKELDTNFEKYLAHKHISDTSWPQQFAGFILAELCKMYHARGWVQQFHLGAMRNLNTRLFSLLGADAGTDSIGDHLQAERMAAFFDHLNGQDKLAKTILYNLHPGLNEVFATMAGNFNDGTCKGKIQYGPGWWFLDQKGGIEKQMNALSEMGVISTFIGMTTDSRSFLSYSRHDYFRRILCNLFGREMANGLLPNDEQWIGGIIRQICYENAKAYFDF